MYNLHIIFIHIYKLLNSKFWNIFNVDRNWPIPWSKFLIRKAFINVDKPKTSFM